MWLFLLGVTFSFIIPAVNFYIAERRHFYVLYILYILFSVVFIFYTLVKYNNLSFFNEVDISLFYSYERVIHSIPPIFYYTFLWSYVEKSDKKKLYRKILNFIIVMTIVSAILLTTLELYEPNVCHDLLTLFLSLIILISIAVLCVLLIKDRNKVYKLIGIGFLSFMILVTGSLLLDKVSVVNTLIDNPHKMYLIGMIVELTLLNYALNLSNLAYRESLNLEKQYMEGLALKSQMNPHFVHNALNSIQYYIQRNEVEHSENYLSKFSKLIRLFFEYSRRNNITIKEEIDLLTHYLEIEKLRFEEKLSYSIDVQDEIDIEDTMIPSMILQPLVENAVNHGIFHKKENGNIQIVFSLIGESLYIGIKDDGIGVKKSKHIFKKSVKNYQSHSSEVLKERLELLNQSKEWEIDYRIEDLSDKSTENGTIVTLIIKHNMI